MSDEFLKDYYQSPKETFSGKLRRQLNSLEVEEARKPAGRILRAFPAAGLALLLALSLALFALPAVRAQIHVVFQEVGGILFNETGRYPGVPEAQVTLAPSHTMTLAAAQEGLPFAIALPEWLPEGYTLIDEVTVTDFTESGILLASIQYRNPEPWRQYLSLNIHYKTDGQPWKQIVGQNSTEEVQVNGQPAALVRGIWNSQTQRWDNPERLALLWQHQGVTYELQSVDAAIPVEMLIQIAESIP